MNTVSASNPRDEFTIIVVNGSGIPSLTEREQAIVSMITGRFNTEKEF